MPWRDDFVKAFWLDPDYHGLGGYLGEKETRAHAQPAEGSPTRMRPVPNKVTKTYPIYRRPSGTREPIGAAVIRMRDRIGFEYEREVGLDDFVSIRDASQLLDLPVMTLSRWVKTKRIKSTKRKGFVLIQLKEVLRLGNEKKRNPKLGYRLIVVQ